MEVGEELLGVNRALNGMTYLSRSPSRMSSRALDVAPARVWIFQPRIEHYRLPLFDRLIELARQNYTIEVFGRLQDGEAAGGGRRTYFRETAYRHRNILGADFRDWPQLGPLVQRERPDVVIVNAHLRHLDCWMVPSLCHHLGIAAVGWGKVHSFSGLPRPLLRIAKRAMFRRFDYFIAYGQSSRAEMLGLGIADDRICVAQNTIDTRRIFDDHDALAARGAALRRAHGLKDRLVLLAVARFDPEKRLHDLLDAWPRLRATHPKLHLVLVGGGQLLDEIAKRAAALDPDRVLVTGRVPEGDDYAWIAAADVTIQCGAVGLAVNQSMAFGKATIIADEIGADTEIVEHRRTGWRYPRGDLDAMVATVDEVLSDPDRTRAVTTAARGLMRSSVTIDRMAQSMNSCIERALEISKHRRGLS